MLTAHCDEIGFLVSNIDDNGYLYVQEIGGIDTDLLPGRKVEIHTNQTNIGCGVGGFPLPVSYPELGKQAPGGAAGV